MNENQAAKPVDSADLSRCNFGATSVEKMETVDSMDAGELTPSREKTEMTPINPVFKHLIHFEVRRSIH
jgi:hypothetical protein